MRPWMLWLLLAVVGCASAKTQRDTSVDLAVAPTAVMVGVGQAAVLHATSARGTLADVSWTAANPTIATVDLAADGAATVHGVAIGTTTITAELAGTTATVAVTVTAAALERIDLTAAVPSLAKGTQTTITARGHYSDGRDLDLTAMVTWASSDPGVATVLDGQVTAVGVGVTDLTATLGTVSGRLGLAVTAATLRSFTIAVPPATLPKGLTYQLVATGLFSDDSSQDVTAMVAWTVVDPTVATVDAAGVVHAVKVGTTRIDAAIDVLRGSTTVAIAPAALTAIAISPSPLALPLGAQAALHAAGTYTDGSSADVTAAATWTATGVTVTATGGVTASLEGTAQVTATIGAIHGDATIIVGPPVVRALTISPPTASVAAGRVVPYAALAIRTDDTTFDATTQVTWAVDNAALAAFATTAGSEGRCQTLKKGPVVVTANLGAVATTAALTIGPAVLDALAVAPATPTITKGGAQPFTATGVYSDATQIDLTTMAAWAAVPSTVATITTSGIATGVGVGAATITATLGAISGTTTLTVNAAAATSLTLSTGDLTLAQQQRAYLHATLGYSDGSTSDVTATATWTSDLPTVATVTAGRVDTQQLAQVATITVTAGGQTAILHVTVTTAACHPVINELQTAGATAADEWVELYNPCTIALSVAGWTVNYRAATNVGASDGSLLATLSGTMSPGELRLFAGAGYTGGPTPDAVWGGGASGLLAGASGAIGLRSGASSTGPLVDALAYGTLTAGHPFLEGLPAAALTASRSLARLPLDGVDTDANATDFHLTNPSGAATPRARNAP